MDAVGQVVEVGMAETGSDVAEAADVDASVAGTAETDAVLAGPAKVCTCEVLMAQIDAA